MKNIKNEDTPGIKITRTGFDPETNRVTSKVEYFPQENVKLSLAKFLKEFKYLKDKNPKDVKLKQLYNKALQQARELKEHLVVNYD